MLVLRRGHVSARSIAALHKDPRLELFVADEMNADSISFAQRVAGVIIATDGDPLSALAYVVTAGVSGPFVVIMNSRYAAERPVVLQAGAIACFTAPMTIGTVGRLIPMFEKKSGVAHIDSALHLVLDPIGRVVRYQDRIVRLSQREFAVLHCLSAQRGRPVGAEELMTVVWGDTLAGARPRQILDVYVCQLRKKLHQLGLDGVISTVRRFGYALGQVA